MDCTTVVNTLHTNEQAWIAAQKIRHWVTGMPSLDLKTTALIVQRSWLNSNDGNLAQRTHCHLSVNKSYMVVFH